MQSALAASSHHIRALIRLPAYNTTTTSSKPLYTYNIMNTLYEPEDPSLLNSPALPNFQACIILLARKALQSGMSEASVDAVFKQHQTCLDIALDALTQAFGPLHTRSDPSMTIRSNESAATAFRRKSHRAMHRFTDKHRPEAEATVHQEAPSDSEPQLSAEKPPMTDGENSHVKRLSRLNARHAAREGVDGYGGSDYDSDMAEDGRSDGSSAPVPGSFPFPIPFRTAAGAQHVGRPERRPQVSDENTFERLPPPVPDTGHARDTTSAPGPFPLPFRTATGVQHDGPSDSQPQDSDDNTRDWLPAPVTIAENVSGSDAIRSDDNTFDCLPPPIPVAEHGSESNAIRSHGKARHLPDRPSTPDRPIVPQDFKEGGRGEPAPWSVNRAKRKETTEDWKADLTESPKPSRTADRAIVPQETNASNHGGFVDQQAKKVEFEEDFEDREAETTAGESRVFERLVPQDIRESDLSTWMMTSN
jgi:hypothetical protein